MVTKIIILILVAALIGIILVVINGIKRAKNQDQDPLEERLAEFISRGEAVRRMNCSPWRMRGWCAGEVHKVLVILLSPVVIFRIIAFRFGW